MRALSSGSCCNRWDKPILLSPSIYTQALRPRCKVWCGRCIPMTHSPLFARSPGSMGTRVMSR